jgi:hypothetical protein
MDDSIAATTYIDPQHEVGRILSQLYRNWPDELWCIKSKKQLYAIAYGVIDSLHIGKHIRPSMIYQCLE